MLRFSKENQHIPWRRILESARHVFDKTRTPVDLKDKWRNIISKEGKITNRNILVKIIHWLFK